ncbi:MAG: hypothetical protein CMB73_05760 [Euryarchaeota archaeon]|nr:hypothetical protein [Euryarchaeota archaeon]
MIAVGSFCFLLIVQLEYFTDYCDTHLTHDSATVRKQHNSGFKHKANVRAYYAQFQLLPATVETCVQKCRNEATSK